MSFRVNFYRKSTLVLNFFFVLTFKAGLRVSARRFLALTSRETEWDIYFFTADVKPYFSQHIKKLEWIRVNSTIIRHFYWNVMFQKANFGSKNAFCSRFLDEKNLIWPLETILLKIRTQPTSNGLKKIPYGNWKIRNYFPFFSSSILYNVNCLN